jgi:hypothetical protein
VASAFFYTVKSTGSYFVLVDDQSGAGVGATYHLSVTVYPPSDRKCTTYTSTDVPKTIPAASGGVTSTLNVPNHVKFSNLKVNLSITHAATADLDGSLVGSDNNEVVLFDDPSAAGAGATAPQIDAIIDDEAAIPITGATYWKTSSSPKGMAASTGSRIRTPSAHGR